MSNVIKLSRGALLIKSRLHLCRQTKDLHTLLVPRCTSVHIQATPRLLSAPATTGQRHIHTSTSLWDGETQGDDAARRLHLDELLESLDSMRSSDSEPRPLHSPERKRVQLDANVPPNRQMMVRNLAYHVTAAELKDLFPGALAVRIPQDHETGQSRGFGFVEFETLEEATEAIENINGTEFEGRIIHCLYSKPKASTTPTPMQRSRGGMNRMGYGYAPEGRGVGFRGRRFGEEEEYETQYDEENETELDDLRAKHRQQIGRQHSNTAGMTFADFGITDQLVSRLADLGYEKPFEIQTKTIQHTLQGSDVIAKSVTGSGKTLAFSIPIVHKIQTSRRERPGNPKAIVISPTRELCLQIYRSIQELDPRIRCVALYGGASTVKQGREIQRGADVICATPGRLADFYRQGLYELSDLQFLCLDEADELLTPNFQDQIEDILESSPASKQMFMFSATMPKVVEGVTARHMKSPVTVDITDSQKYKAPESVQHLCMQVNTRSVKHEIAELLKTRRPERCIVFVETKLQTSSVGQYLRHEHNLRAEPINSNLSQSRRETIMNAFRAGKINTLVATDVAARGIDVPEIDLIIQTPPRNGTEYYIHRSGRTGRAGRDGTSITLYDAEDNAQCAVMREVNEMVELQFLSGTPLDFARARGPAKNRYSGGGSRHGGPRGRGGRQRRDWWDN